MFQKKSSVVDTHPYMPTVILYYWFPSLSFPLPMTIQGGGWPKLPLYTQYCVHCLIVFNKLTEWSEIKIHPPVIICYLSDSQPWLAIRISWGANKNDQCRGGTSSMVEWAVQQFLSPKSHDKIGYNCQNQPIQGSENQPKAYTTLTSGYS